MYLCCAAGLQFPNNLTVVMAGFIPAIPVKDAVLT